MVEMQAASMADGIEWPPGSALGQVRSVHNDYVNIGTEDGLLTLVRSGKDHIPFGIEVELAEGWLATGVMPNQLVYYAADKISVGEILVITGVDSCPRFSCQPVMNRSAKGIEVEKRLKLLQRVYLTAKTNVGIEEYIGWYDARWFRDPKATVLEAGDAPAVRSLKRLVCGIRGNDEQLIGEGVKGLLGLGPGSTPSGDDFLLGFHAGISCTWASGCPSPIAAMARQIKDNAANLTTFLSVEYIRYGLRGRYHQRVNQMINAFQADTGGELVRRAQELTELGHSSGTDLLYGFIYGGFAGLAITQTANERKDGL